MNCNKNSFTDGMHKSTSFDKDDTQFKIELS